MSAIPFRRRPRATETPDDRIPNGESMALDGDTNPLQGNDFDQGRRFGEHRDHARENGFDSQQNGRTMNKISNQGIKRGAKGLSRSKSPVRSGKPSKFSKFCRGVRILFKWSILFTILGGIGWSGWILWNWIGKTPSEPVANPIDLGNEGKVAELEGFLKKTTKMLQVQLELVDMKYGKEVEGLKKHLEESIEKHASSFYKELGDLKGRTVDMEGWVVKLKDSQVLTKEEVLGLVKYVVDTRAGDGGGDALSLDDVRAVVRRLVEAEIEKHAADGLGRVDYALGSGGGRVAHHSEGYFPGRSWRFSSLNFLHKSGMHPYASKVVEPSFGEPGQCLPLKGSKVFVVISLRTAVFVEAVALEHVAKSVAYDRSSAPKEFRIFGWLDIQNEGVSKEAEQMLLLGEFTYDLKKSSAQTFNLPVELTGKLVNMIKVDVQTNHGSSSHTCIYRLRVHGKEPKIIRPAELDT